MFLKHLNPLNNIRVAQGVEIVNCSLSINKRYLEKLQPSYQRVSRATPGHRVRDGQDLYQRRVHRILTR